MPEPTDPKLALEYANSKFGPRRVSQLARLSLAISIASCPLLVACITHLFAYTSDPIETLLENCSMALLVSTLCSLVVLARVGVSRGAVRGMALVLISLLIEAIWWGLFVYFGSQAAFAQN